MRVEFNITKDARIESVTVGTRTFTLSEPAEYPGDIQRVLEEINTMRVLQTSYVEEKVEIKEVTLQEIERDLKKEKRKRTIEPIFDGENLVESIERFLIQNEGWWNASRMIREMFKFKSTEDPEYKRAYKQAIRALKILIEQGKVLAVFGVARDVQIRKYGMDPAKSRDGHIYSYNTEYGTRLGADLFKRSV